MASWPLDPTRPDLQTINDGQQFTDGSAVVADTFNKIVLTLLTLKPRPGTHSVRIKCNYPWYGDDVQLVDAAYSVDGGTTWIPINNGSTISVATPQIRFRIGCFVNHVTSIRIQSETLQLNMSRSTFGYSLTPVYAITRDITDVIIT